MKDYWQFSFTFGLLSPLQTLLHSFWVLTVPPAAGACPARVPPRAAGLQAALAGAARRVTRPRPGGGGAGGRGAGGRRGGAKRALNFLSALHEVCSGYM
jgi:hypothetical protein